MKAISLLTIVPIAVSIGACTGDERGPGDDLAAQKIRVDDSDTRQNDLTIASPDFVRIRSLSWAGSGCPAGSIDPSLTPGAFTLLFASYVAEIGPGVPLSLSRKNCQILLDLDFSQGWSFSVADVEYRGSVRLESGVSGVQESAFNFQGETRTARLQTTLRGPRVGDYQIHDSLGLADRVWSPCGAQRALIINSEVRLLSDTPDARGMMSLHFTSSYGLQWRRCPA